MHEWGFKQYRKRPIHSIAAASKLSTTKESRAIDDDLKNQAKRDVRAVDKFIELAIVLDQAMVRNSKIIEKRSQDHSMKDVSF